MCSDYNINENIYKADMIWMIHFLSIYNYWAVDSTARPTLVLRDDHLRFSSDIKILTNTNKIPLRAQLKTSAKDKPVYRRLKPVYRQL